VKDYAHFKGRLAEASRWEDKIKICLEGIFNNVFLRGAKIISDLDLETLRLRFPELYETVKDKEVRKALVVSELFKVAYKRPTWGSLDDEVEVEFDHRCNYMSGMLTCICQKDFGDSEELYGGRDAVKVFFKSIHLIAEELDVVLSSPILADPWRAKSGLESKRDLLREVMCSKFEEIAERIPEEAKRFGVSKKFVDVIPYELWHWYRGVGKRVKRRIEELLRLNE